MLSKNVLTISADIVVCCPVITPITAIPIRRTTPITLLGTLSMISDAIKIPNGAPKRPNIVINCDFDVS